MIAFVERLIKSATVKAAPHFQRAWHRRRALGPFGASSKMNNDWGFTASPGDRMAGR
jgi:hypothetical protein